MDRSKWHPEKAPEYLKNIPEPDLIEMVEAEITEQDLKDELRRRLGERGLKFSYLVSQDDIEVLIKPETEE